MLFFDGFLYIRESTVHTVVERFFIVLVHISCSCRRMLVMTMLRENALAAKKHGLRISASFRILEGSIMTKYSNMIESLVRGIQLVDISDVMI